jgi:hypothetical protein
MQDMGGFSTLSKFGGGHKKKMDNGRTSINQDRRFTAKSTDRDVRNNVFCTPHSWITRMRAFSQRGGFLGRSDAQQITNFSGNYFLETLRVVIRAGTLLLLLSPNLPTPDDWQDFVGGHDFARLPFFATVSVFFLRFWLLG